MSLSLEVQPPQQTADWAQEYFRLPAEGADKPGPYDLQYAPYLFGIFNALDDPLVSEVYTMKAAQVGWTFGLIAYLGKKIATEPCAMVVMFPKADAARQFNDEKLEPSIRSTPRLSRLIDVSKTRSKDNRALFKKFPSGFLKLVGSNSISDVKSTPAKLVIIEEPDDSTSNLKDQGNTIALLFERTKRIRNSKRVLGGTPSVKGLSKVEEHILRSDQRVLPIYCHDCGSAHVLDWDNVSWLQSETSQHEIYGVGLPETAVYVCPYCGSSWDDYQRKKNIRDTVNSAIDSGDSNCGWVATADFHGSAGFKELSELYSCLPGVGVKELVRDYLAAEYKANTGDETDKIVFVNSKLGRPYEYKDDNANAEQLKEKALAYEELVIPRNGLMVTVGVDIQHDRIAVIMRAWGRGEESWLVLWKEISASVSTTDKNDPVWRELETIVYGAIQHESGGHIYASAVSIDSSDGNTSDGVYSWVRRMNKKHRQVITMAIKGSSAQTDPEIFVTPKLKGVDHVNPKKQTKADKHGLKVFMVGTNKAKDLITSRLKLSGHGDGRFHYYENVRVDYYDQMTGEVKAPHRSIRNRKVWQQKSGRAIEAWDCEVYALHAARAKRIHLMSVKQWDALEEKLNQADMFSQPEVSSENVADEPKKKLKRSGRKSNRSKKYE
jgi:phage terminase large subunit GpA-like protein